MDPGLRCISEDVSSLALHGRWIYGPRVWSARTRARKFLWGGTLVLASSGVAFAQSNRTDTHTAASFSLELARDEQASVCPDADWFRARVASHAGPAGQAGTFKITLRRRGEVWQGKIQRWGSSSDEPAAERVLSDRSTACAPIAEAVAVTVAILADDFAQHPEPPAPLPSEAEVVELAPSAPRSSEPSDTKVWVGAGGGATLSFIAPLAPLLGFGLGLDTTHLRQGLRLMLTTEQKFELSPGSVVVQAWLLTVLSCWRFQEGPFGAAVCGNLDGSMLRASAEGFAGGKSTTRPYGAAGLELQPSWFIGGRYRISAAAGALVPFTRESFSVTGKGVAYVPPAVSWRVLLLSEIGAF